MPGGSMGMINLGELFEKGFGQKKEKRKLSVKESYDILIDEESEKLIDNDNLIKRSIANVEEDGIVFIDEIDKICGKNTGTSGEVSREGVQRDLLPLIEGSTVSTKYGSIKQIIYFSLLREHFTLRSLQIYYQNYREDFPTEWS